MEIKTRKTVLAVDFNNVVFASYYGQHLINSKGINVNAVKGFFMKLKMLKETFDPDYIVFASDLSRAKTFRRKMYPEYKAQRKPQDPNILEQMKYIGRLNSLLGFRTINDELYEADDILGMISRFNEDCNMDTIIISSDRDLYQLVTDHTFIMSPRSSDFVDKAYIKEHYNLTPEQWIDLKTLQGDTSDNIPGIRGIGNKTALKLMNEYGSIDNIYQHLDELKTGVREHLENGKEIIPITRELVTIVTDYTKIGFEEKLLWRRQPYADEIYELLSELEVFSLFDIMRYSLLPQQGGKLEVQPS